MTDHEKIGKLLAVLKAAGVKHFRHGDLEIVFDRPVDILRSRRAEAVSVEAVLPEPVS